MLGDTLDVVRTLSLNILFLLSEFLSVRDATEVFTLIVD